MINIDELIRESALARDPSVAVYRLIKAEFLRWVKDNPGKDFNEATEQKILKKMRDQRKDSLDQYTKAGRTDLAEIEAKEIEVLQQFLPKEVSPKEIENFTRLIIIEQYNSKVSMKDIKSILSIVQATYPGADGKIVSKVVKTYT